MQTKSFDPPTQNNVIFLSFNYAFSEWPLYTGQGGLSFN